MYSYTEIYDVVLPQPKKPPHMLAETRRFREIYDVVLVI